MILHYIPKEEFDRVNLLRDIDKYEKLSLIAAMCRLNTLVEVKKAGSGHLGSSMSAMDLVVYLYFNYLNVVSEGIGSPDRDIYFSSKGHDVPGLYAVLYALGIIPESKFLNLRRFGGLDGHPDINIPGIEANTGSLGMGISKARGIAYAIKKLKRKGRVFVLTGDGEFQEGQNFEALQSTIQQGIFDLTVIMDHNKLQSDRLVQQIVDLGDIEKKVSCFGWHVERCNGHDFKSIEDTLKRCENITDKPKFIICDTIKGKGVSFMEHPRALELGGGFYKWHSGAPDDDSFNTGYDELNAIITDGFKKSGLGEVHYKECEAKSSGKLKSKSEFVSLAYGETLYGLMKDNPALVVLDADLSGDCRLLEIEQKHPENFIECGIAEQDMVSMAAGLALQGLLPVVNTFASFLAARANEQIYNALTENTKMIFMCHYAGLIPAGPGKSHQSVRDISLFGAFPNCEIFQPANPLEMKMILEYTVIESKVSSMIRMPIGPSPSIISLPDGYRFNLGRGVALSAGNENVLLTYGPVMLNEAILAGGILRKQGIDLKIINVPCLNRFDRTWYAKELEKCSYLYVLEDHSTFGGLADNLLDFMLKNDMCGTMKITKFGVESFPACGTPQEALKFHGLDGESLARKIVQISGKRP